MGKLAQNTMNLNEKAIEAADNLREIVENLILNGLPEKEVIESFIDAVSPLVDEWENVIAEIDDEPGYEDDEEDDWDWVGDYH